MKRRQNLARLDDDVRQQAVIKARSKLFKRGQKINGTAVQSTLQARSLTATKVYLIYC
jgi:hypothetical protein